ncbi:MAG: SDR family oxidoreductase [Bacteroidota bacterium]
MFGKNLYKDKIAFITGGRSGIGYAIAKMMLQLGAKVMIASRKAEPLAKAAERLSTFGECAHHPCDIRKTEEIQAVAAAIKEKFGRLDILVNNAGGQFPTLARILNDKGWSAVINNNLNGTFFVTREMANAFFIPQKEGVIVNIIADIHRGFPGMVHTGAARAGVENMTKTLALEWADYNIRINAIAPGTIDSSGLKTYPPQVQEMLEDGRKAVPMERYGTVEDIANAVGFMASSLASYISGVTLYVDGAAHLNGDKLGFTKVLKSFMGG